MVQRAEPLAERGDGRLIGEVDGLGADAGLRGIGGGQCFLVTACRHDLGARVLRGEGDRAGEPAAPPDDEHGLVLQ